MTDGRRLMTWSVCPSSDATPHLLPISSQKTENSHFLGRNWHFDLVKRHVYDVDHHNILSITTNVRLEPILSHSSYALDWLIRDRAEASFMPRASSLASGLCSNQLLEHSHHPLPSTWTWLISPCILLLHLGYHTIPYPTVSSALGPPCTSSSLA